MGEGAPEIGAAALVAVALLLLAAGGVQWYLRRRPGRAEGAIRLVASRALGTKRLLALVDVEGERFLLGLTDERIACLGRLGPAPHAAAGRPAASVADLPARAATGGRA